MPVVSSKVEIHRTFMDTVGRTTLKLTALNVVDDFRDRDVTVTYDYPFTAGFRKPIVIFISVLGIFIAASLVSKLDVSIGRKA
jgi:oligosaccharyltransferase complex subunit alpha (ribophorin I)